MKSLHMLPIYTLILLILSSISFTFLFTHIKNPKMLVLRGTSSLLCDTKDMGHGNLTTSLIIFLTGDHQLILVQMLCTV